MSFGLGVSFGRLCREAKTFAEKARERSDPLWDGRGEWEETERYLVHRTPEGRVDMFATKRALEKVLGRADAQAVEGEKP